MPLFFDQGFEPPTWPTGSLKAGDGTIYDSNANGSWTTFHFFDGPSNPLTCNFSGFPAGQGVGTIFTQKSPSNAFTADGGVQSLISLDCGENPFGGGPVLVAYPGGSNANNVGHSLIFFRTMLALSPGYLVAANGLSKIFLSFSNDASFGQFIVTLELESNPNAQGGTYVLTLSNLYPSGASHILKSSVSPAVFPNFDLVEWMIQLNTSTGGTPNSDGAIALRVNGQNLPWVVSPNDNSVPNPYTGQVLVGPNNTGIYNLQVYSQSGTGIRYLDRIAASDVTWIGAIGGGPPPDTTPPANPTGLQVQ